MRHNHIKKTITRSGFKTQLFDYTSQAGDVLWIIKKERNHKLHSVVMLSVLIFLLNDCVAIIRSPNFHHKNDTA